jgi:hypothetical protein
VAGRPSTAFFAPAERNDMSEPAERTDAADPAEPIDSTDPADPIEPIDPIEPTEPIERIEPSLAIESNDPRDPSDHNDPIVQHIPAVIFSKPSPPVVPGRSSSASFSPPLASGDTSGQGTGLR